MASRLATNPVLIEHGGNAVHLRPSLRAGALLHHSHGLDCLDRDLRTGNLATVLAIVDVTADNPIAARALILDMIAARGVHSLLTLSEKLKDIVIVSFGGAISDGKHSKPDDAIERETIDDLDMNEVFETIFEIGTGWLGWTPAVTWAATPAEIFAARNGLIDKLRAIHGGTADDGDQASHDPREEIAPEKVRAGLAELRGMAG